MVWDLMKSVLKSVKPLKKGFRYLLFLTSASRFSAQLNMCDEVKTSVI